MSIRYRYELVLSLANRQIGLEKIKEEIEFSRIEYNERSLVAKNAKEIVKCEIKEDVNLIYIWLNSSNKMNFPLRGLFLFSKLIMERLNNSEDKEKNELPNLIIRNKCFFKLVGEPKEVKNIKLKRSQYIEDGSLQADVKKGEETNSDLSEVSYLLQKITALFLKTDPNQQEKEDIEAIKSVLISRE